MFGWFKKKTDLEERSSGSGYTAQVMLARENYIAGASGLGELTATVQGCLSLWEGGLMQADVVGTDILKSHSLALAGRSLGLRGEAVFLIRGDEVIPCVDWDLTTRNGKPTAYRLSIPEAGGNRSETALAGEVLHFRIGADPATPYYGTAPLRRAQLTAGLLHVLETALGEVYEHAPIGSQVLPFPETPDTTLEALSRGFRGKRGRVMLRESVNVSAAGGPTPQVDWRPADTTPDLSKAMTKEHLEGARNSICNAFGVLPGILSPATTGPMVREAQRHLAQWQLQPIARMIGEECSEKLGAEVSLDVMRPLQAFDAGGRARALSAVVQTMALSKDAGLDGADLQKALALVDWGEK